MMQNWEGLINHYREFLPVSDSTPVITLHEGGTPLIRSLHHNKIISEDLNIFFKYEGLNPTGSFKDRGMTMAISKAAEDGKKVVICASTGNTSASASAYAARAGMKSVVLIPQGNIAMGKLAQAMIHGSLVLQIDGNFDDALRIVRELVEHHPIAMVNSVNPYRIEGQKTAAFEVCDQLGAAPDYHALPVGNAGNITAYWKGYNEYMKAGRSASLPAMMGFQASGAAPIVLGRPVEKPETVATAIRIGNPASWKGAENARDESGGVIEAGAKGGEFAGRSFLFSNEGVFL